MQRARKENIKIRTCRPLKCIPSTHNGREDQTVTYDKGLLKGVPSGECILGMHREGEERSSDIY